MESKIKIEYLIKWYDLILLGYSADIECDIEEIENIVKRKSSLFYTGKLMNDEIVIKSILLDEIKRAVQSPLSVAEYNYRFIMKKYKLDLESLKKDLESIKEEDVVQLKAPIKVETSAKEVSQLALF